MIGNTANQENSATYAVAFSVNNVISLGTYNGGMGDYTTYVSKKSLTGFSWYAFYNGVISNVSGGVVLMYIAIGC